MGCWREINWRYEKVDGDRRPLGRWSDGIRNREYPDRQILRHEAEAWQFKPNGNLQIVSRQGSVVDARWRLKGRGHVLTIRYPATDDFEVYDIKHLDNEHMVLHYDMGMEVRGLARLEFRRFDESELRADGSCTRVKGGVAGSDPS